MSIQVVHTFAPGTTSATVDIRPGDCFLLLFSDFINDNDARNCLQIGERAYVYAWDPSIYSGNWVTQLNGDLCYLQVSRFTPGLHTITFKNVGNVNVGANVPLAWGAVLRGASPVGIAGFCNKTTNISKYGEITGETTSYPASVVSPKPDAILLSRSNLWNNAAGTGYGAWCELQSAPNGTTVWEFPGQYNLNGELVVSEMPWQIQPFTSATTVNMPSGTFGFILPRYWNIVEHTDTSFWVFYEEDYDGGLDAGASEEEIAAHATGGVTQIGANIESVDIGDGSSEDGEAATRVTQVAAYIESAGGNDSGNGGDEDGVDATRITQIAAYIEGAGGDDSGGGTGEDGVDAARITQISAYVEGAGGDDSGSGTGEDGVEATRITQVAAYVEGAGGDGSGDDGETATRVTQIGAYIEAVIDPTYSATLVRISQAFTLVEARQITITPAPPPGAGDILDRLPEYQQAPPVPLEPVKWISVAEAPTISMPPMPESESAQPYEMPSSGRGDILGITKARVSRSILVDALAATFDAQSIPVQGAAIGSNLAMVNGVPAQTTEASPIAGRTATYTNIGRASMAVYASEVQTPGAQKVGSATDTNPVKISPPANPTTRINVIYPLLGSGSLASDLTIALDENGYQQTIATVLDAIMQSTVTIGYGDGSAPGTINLYVMPGAIDVGTLDGLTVSELYLVGSAEGQILRYNATETQWRPAPEPLDFKGLNLSTNETSNQHGGFRYNPTTKHLEMLVEVA